VSESALASRIAAVRRAIGDSGETQKLIRTVSRKGFRFVGDVLVDDGAVARLDASPVQGAENLLPNAPATVSFAPLDKPSIAVLAFDNVSSDPEQEYFSDGMADDIITELSQNRSLFVIARNSSFTYKGRTVDIRPLVAIRASKRLPTMAEQKRSPAQCRHRPPRRYLPRPMSRCPRKRQANLPHDQARSPRRQEPGRVYRT